jgi:hypothetical protein
VHSIEASFEHISRGFGVPAVGASIGQSMVMTFSQGGIICVPVTNLKGLVTSSWPSSLSDMLIDMGGINLRGSGVRSSIAGRLSKLEGRR